MCTYVERISCILFAELKDGKKRHEIQPGFINLAAAITQFAGGSKKYLGTNHAELT